MCGAYGEYMRMTYIVCREIVATWKTSVSSGVVVVGDTELCCEFIQSTLTLNLREFAMRFV